MVNTNRSYDAIRQALTQRGMGKVIVDVSMSLDGFIAGPQDDVALLQDWIADETVDDRDESLNDSLDSTGAVIMGRRTFNIIDEPEGWISPEGTSFDIPVFVLMHSAREQITKGGTTYTFVRDGIESALRQAHKAARGKNIALMGAHITQQFLKAGLLDEIQLHLVPVIIGEGIRLFDLTGSHAIDLERIALIESSGVTHIRFRVVR